MDIHATRKDIRGSELYREAEAIYKALRQPGTGQISDAAEVHVAPDGRNAVFAGAFLDGFDGVQVSRVCRIDLTSGEIQVLTFGPNTDRLPKYSPDGRWVAFLSDRGSQGNFQLYLVDPIRGGARATPKVDGWVEYLHWSPDGTRVLLGVAAHGADIAGSQGAVTSKRAPEQVPTWMPEVSIGEQSQGGRSAWVYELARDQVHPVAGDCNVWEAAWAGNQAIAAIVSPGAAEGLWYCARLKVIDVTGGEGEMRELYAPKDQLGWPAVSPSGRHLAVVEAVCSDRWLVAGNLLLIDTMSGAVRQVDTQGVDITHCEWQSESQLLVAGHRGFETAVGLCDAKAGTFSLVWSSSSISSGAIYIKVSGLNEAGDCVLVGENFTQAPEIAVIRQGKYEALRSFDVGYNQEAKAIRAVEQVRWNASDGLEIHGWLLRPQVTGRHALVMYVHGGPVWQWHLAWLGRGRGVTILMLLKRGYAVFLPNPRGSSGRGQEFARKVVGEMGAADTYDLLSGLDHLVKEGIADQARLGVCGVSYGGFMTSWLITQDPRFAAAVSVAPVTNYVSATLISNIPQFYKAFLADTYTNPGGKYFYASPIMHAHKVKTPTLNICGTLDRCTPPEEAMQFHSALVENGVTSVLATYPEEGHGVRKFPAVFDYLARLVGWFEAQMPPGGQGCA